MVDRINFHTCTWLHAYRVLASPREMCVYCEQQDGRIENITHEQLLEHARQLMRNVSRLCIHTHPSSTMYSGTIHRKTDLFEIFQSSANPASPQPITQQLLSQTTKSMSEPWWI